LLQPGAEPDVHTTDKQIAALREGAIGHGQWLHALLREERMGRHVGPQADRAPAVQGLRQIRQGALRPGMRIIETSDDVQGGCEVRLRHGCLSIMATAPGARKSYTE
jgi:hypothetical protein